MTFTKEIKKGDLTEFKHKKREMMIIEQTEVDSVHRKRGENEPS